MKKIIYSSFVLGTLVLASCSKEFTKNDLNSNFSDEQTAALAAFPESAMVLNNGLESGGLSLMFKSGVAEVGQHEDFGQKSVDITMDAMSNDVAYANMSWFSYQYTYSDRLESYNTATIYNYYSKLSHSANQVIQSVMRTNGATYKTSEIYARALALRGFANLNLIRLYEYNGDGISLEKVDDAGNFTYQFNRVPAKDVREFIESDLTTAYSLLEDYKRPNVNYIDGTVVAGLLSRFYLYTEEFSKAKDYASKALKGDLTANSFESVNNGNFSSISNNDWMWGTAINGSNTTFYASYFSHMDSFNVGYGRVGNTTKSIDMRLYAEMNDTDKRKGQWFADGKKSYTSPNWGRDENDQPVTKVIPQYVNTKFIDKTKFLGAYCYMRKTEVLFNYIEAAIKLGDEGGATALLNDYMTSRDASYNIGKRLAKHDLFREFQIQKRIELWGEGFGLLDMKRWNVSLDRKYEGTNHIVNGQLTITAPSAQFTFQFPKAERDANTLLSPQNPVK